MESLTTLLQLASAFSIFAAGYLFLLLSIVICVAIASCVFKAGRWAWAYTAKSGMHFRREDAEKIRQSGRRDVGSIIVGQNEERATRY